MGHEISYIAHDIQIRSDQACYSLSDQERYLKKLEEEIFSYICMSPDKIRNTRRKKGKDGGCDDECLDNAQYLCGVWEELKEQWREAFHEYDASSAICRAVEDKTYTVELCPDCHRQVKSEYSKNSWDWVWKCPKCGKTVENPVEAVIDTILSEG